MLDIIALFILGALGAANLIIAKKPEAKEVIAKVTPYQGWIGLVCAIWGAWRVIAFVLHIGIMTTWPIMGLTWLIDSLLLLTLGLLFGVGVLKTFIKAEAANQKLDEIVGKIAPFQGTLGVIALVAAVWTLLEYYVLKI